MVKFLLKKDPTDLLIFSIFILLSFITTFMMFSGWNYIHQIDAWFTLNPEKQLQDIFYFWKDGSSLGYSSPDFHTILFNVWQVGLLRFFGLFFGFWEALVISQFVIYWITLLVGMIFAFLFFSEFYRTLFVTQTTLEGKRAKAILCLISILYVFNQYTLIYVFYRYTAWTLIWVGLPLIAFFLLRYLKAGSSKYLLWVGTSTFLTPLSGLFSLGTLPILIIALFLLFLCGYMIKPNKGYIIRFVAFLITLSLFNSASLIPQVLGIRYMVSGSQVSLGTDIEGLMYSSRFTNVLNIFRFLGYYGLYGGQYRNFPFVWFEVFRSPVIQVLTFVYAGVLSISLLSLHKEKIRPLKKVYLLVFGVMLALIFIMKGVNEPLPNAGYWLITLNSVFFRHPYDRFVHLFAFLYFLSFFYILYKISENFKRTGRFAISLILVVVVLLPLCYPLFTGDVVHPTDRINLSNTSYWMLRSNATAAFSGSTDHRVLIMPFVVDSQEYTYNISGTVHHPNDKSILYYILPDAEVIQFPKSSQENDLLYILYHAMTTQRYEEFTNIAKKLGISYIAYQKDVSDTFILGSEDKEIINLSPSFVENLEKKGLIIKTFDNENIILYRLNGPFEDLLFTSVPIVGTENPYLLTKIHDASLIFVDNLKLLYYSVKPDVLLLNANSTEFNGEVWDNLRRITVDCYETASNTGWEHGRILTPTEFFQAFYTENTRKYSEKGSNITEDCLVQLLDFESNLTDWDFTEEVGWNTDLSPDSYSGNYSLKVATDISEDWSWSKIKSPVINVTPGEVLSVITHMKFQNVRQSHIVLYGYDSSAEMWRQLRQVPPGQDERSDWQEYKGIIEIPPGITKVRVWLNAGWVSKPVEGNATTWFDGIKIYNVTKYTKPITLENPCKVDKTDNYLFFVHFFENQKGGILKVHINGNQVEIKTQDQLEKLVWKELGTFHIEKGDCKIVFENVEGFNAVDSFALISEKEYDNLREEVRKITANKIIAYLFEGESDLYTENTEILKDLNASNEEVIKFKDAGKSWKILEIIRNGNYTLALKGTGTFNVSIAKYSYLLTLNNSTLNYTQMFALNAGDYELEIFPLSKDAVLDVIWLYSSVNDQTLEEILGVNERPADVYSFQRINPTLWEAGINSEKPFMLIFGETYDPLWVTNVYKDGQKGESVKSFPVYSVFNGFWINETGQLNITIEYLPQRWFYYGSIISTTTLLACLTYLTHDWTKNKAILKRVIK